MMIDGNFKIATDSHIHGGTTAGLLHPAYSPPRGNHLSSTNGFRTFATLAFQSRHGGIAQASQGHTTATDSGIGFPSRIPLHPAQHQFCPYTLGKLLQQRTYQPVAIPDDSPPPVIRLRTAPRALPHPRDEPRSPLLDFNG